MLKHRDLVEADFLREGLDFDDWLRPADGVRTMSTRRMLLVVNVMLDKLTSQFWSQVLDRDPISRELYVLTDIFHAVTGQAHPIRTRREDEKKRAEMEKKKALVRAYDAQRRARFAEKGFVVQETPTTR